MKTTSTKSKTVCVAPISGCLVAAENFIGSTDWIVESLEQRRFIGDYHAIARNEIGRLPELESMASEHAADLNRFLRERGFGIELPEFDRSQSGFGVASVLKILLEWVKPGIVTNVRGGYYPAVLLKSDVSFFKPARSFFGFLTAQYPIVSIKAKNGDRVFMAMCGNAKEGLDLLKQVYDLSNGMASTGGYDGVIFPMIDYDENIDISWIERMRINSQSGPWYIERALQQTKFRMNEIGAKVESAATMSMKLMYCDQGESLPPLVIDRPFLLWVKRAGLTHPLFAAHFTEENWKRPEKL